MEKHTPGPWYSMAKTDDRQGLICEEKTGRSVAVSYDPVDAALIAAAPDLLESLRTAERTLRWAAQESTGRVSKEIVGGILHHADEARAAIAKATA